MDPAQGETQGKSITSKLKAKVKGVKGKVHLPGRKKRQEGDGGQGGDADSSDYSSSDDSPKKPGPETGYNIGESTPFTTVRTTPLSPAREETTRNTSKHHPPATSQPPRSMVPTLDEKFQYRDGGDVTSAAQGYGYDEHDARPKEGVLAKVKDSVGGAAAAVGSKVGYYTEVDRTPAVQPPPSDSGEPSIVDKAKATLGMGASKTTAATSTSPSQPGVVDRVTGAVSSLFTGSPKETNTGADVQHTFPAQTDYVPPHNYTDRSGGERMRGTHPGDYNQTMDRY